MMNKSFITKNHTDRSWHAKTILCPVCDSVHHREFFNLLNQRYNPQRLEDIFVNVKIAVWYT